MCFNTMAPYSKAINLWFKVAKNPPVLLDQKCTSCFRWINQYSSLTVVCAVQVLSYPFSMIIPRCDYKCLLFMSACLAFSACLPFSACRPFSACVRSACRCAAYSVLAACMSISSLNASFLPAAPLPPVWLPALLLTDLSFTIFGAGNSKFATLLTLPVYWHFRDDCRRIKGAATAHYQLSRLFL